MSKFDNMTEDQIDEESKRQSFEYMNQGVFDKDPLNKMTYEELLALQKKNEEISNARDAAKKNGSGGGKKKTKKHKKTLKKKKHKKTLKKRK